MAKTINYERRGEGLWHPKSISEDDFEDDAVSSRPSYVPRDRSILGTNRPIGVVGIVRMFLRMLRYLLLFLFAYFIISAAWLIALFTGTPQQQADFPTGIAIGLTMVAAFFCVLYQIKLDRRKLRRRG